MPVHCLFDPFLYVEKFDFSIYKSLYQNFVHAIHDHRIAAAFSAGLSCQIHASECHMIRLFKSQISSFLQEVERREIIL